MDNLASKIRFLGTLLTLVGVANATEYHVGPAEAYTQIGQVPWYRLRPGDTVYIHYRSEPYREKILISSRGTAAQWIRILGMPGPKGELPVISGDGATTSRNMHYRWPDATGDRAIQWSGIIQIAYREGDDAPKPGYIEIANLQVQDGYSAFQFTAESGQNARYGDFCACVYSRSADHVLIRDNVLANCGLGFYNWTGSGTNWWDGLQSDTVLRGNYFHGNGIRDQYSQHASYTESDRVTIEFNRFGPMRDGALGSQIKDRSAGTVIRYNYIEQPQGWMIDLVEPENGDPTLSSRPYFKESWVYGNALLYTGAIDGPLIHWNEDHNMNRGRADKGGTLFFYNNTFAITRDEPDIWKFPLFSVHSGGWSCPSSTPGVIDARNNIWANLPRTPKSGTALMFLAGCGVENFVFGKNWISPGWTMAFNRKYAGKAVGLSEFMSPPNNDPGFVDLKKNDVHLIPGSSAASLAGPLAPQVTRNTLGLDLTPNLEYLYHTRTSPRSSDSDSGAFSRNARPAGDLRSRRASK